MLCRLCIKHSDSFLYIFDKNGLQLEIADILGRHFWFMPDPDDISLVICSACWMKVNDFHEFYVTVEKRHATLTSYDFKKETFNEMDNEFIDPILTIKEELSKTPLLGNEGSKRLTDELNPLCEVESDEVTNRTRLEKNDVSMYTSAETIGNTGGSTSSANFTLENVRNDVIEKISTKKLQMLKEENLQHEHKGKKTFSVKTSREDDDMVKKYIQMTCELCAYISGDYISMRKHFRIQHPKIKAFVRCCNKKLFDRLEIVRHAYKHHDPEFFKCKECEKVYSDQYTLKFHLMHAHESEGLNFACDQCPKKFARQNLLELHRGSHVPISERTFVCEQCPKSRFASNNLLKIHISMRHRRAVNVCHVCAKEIRDKQSFEKHVRLHFEATGPRVKCPRPGCDSWLKDEEILRQHLGRHNDEGLIFTCDQCGRNCKNRRALRSHILCVHSKEVFTCGACNKTFKKAVSLREHMATHTGETLYKCPFCTRTFNSSANMHSHKKKMHPVEWDIWRKAKIGDPQYVISKQQTDV
ncbi:PREDICTED: transcription factor grauzone-like isoform X1 [Rhagoletis zephyria]|uniref:transcription factor grauzone-like isoform X1 n=1 Tax=Rhagoletis zephyria TaxID=28612 RepID=UPI0008119799|nr:PREDICTED: transcription factor grauzone-like isoform X1 [Rhagoletis zephyria]XP_017491961.1 PREDICTED: transcription factor grauzone-like isoform X1 [Rhagoletis zephyria]XP_017491969.1 PREDICTED: transcription factor grauzone-like isoform X1 [Rhagoletis zephyria]